MLSNVLALTPQKLPRKEQAGKERPRPLKPKGNLVETYSQVDTQQTEGSGGDKGLAIDG